MRGQIRAHGLRSTILVLLISLWANNSHAMGERVVMEGVSMTGVDHLADHLSVQDFWVDGRHGFQAGKGGRVVCCARIPLKWTAATSIEVRWEVANWREGTWRCFRRRVSLDPYAELGELFVHFLPGWQRQGGGVQLCAVDSSLPRPSNTNSAKGALGSLSDATGYGALS